MSRSSEATLTDRAVAVIKEYGGGWENGDRTPPIRPGDERLTKTEVAAFASALLKAADIPIFELAMWEAWHA
jgi:hypothetical protein